MCGIAGILSLAPDAPVAEAELRSMAAALVHRGPDDEGIHVDRRGRCGLAFRRLSIIDLTTGHQPMSNEDGTLHLVFNGEIYNFRTLRDELEALGHRFQTRSDSETILHAFEQWSYDAFARLAGMFAIALWDERSGALTLARDRFGKKPLVCARHAGRLYFASELKAILAVPGMPRELDPQSLHEYLLLQYVAAPRSIYRGFWKIAPATAVAYHERGPGDATAPTVRYWSPPRRPTFGGSYDDAKDELGRRLTSAVEKRLISDVPLGAFLSGGIDSSVIVAIMRGLGVAPLRTFSIGFDDAAYDETRYARLVAEHVGAEHKSLTVTPDARGILDTLAWHYDEPFADSSAIPTYYVAKMTRDFVTVAMTGDGGDEALGGYDRYRAAAIAARADVLPAWMRRAAASLGSLLPHGEARTLSNRAYRLLTAIGQRPARRYLSWVNVFSPASLATMYRPEFLERIRFDEPLDWFERLHDRGDEPAPQRANRLDLETYLPFALLTKVDIASMACSLECRAPFLDHELIEFALTLPWGWKMSGGVGKRILRDWATGLLPREVLTRGKMGFGVPVGRWFRGELQELLVESVLGDDALSVRLFRPERLRAMVSEHQDGRVNHEHALWSLLMLENWRRRWSPSVDLPAH